MFCFRRSLLSSWCPLSLGRVEKDCIRCMYHGIKYDTDGKVIEIPGQDFIGPNHKVQSFPIVEKGNLLWIWMGILS